MLHATLGLEEASRRRWGALVVGAGPAGALAAHELARNGAGVLLVDKSAFPRTKVCGSCFNGRALAVLESVGLGALVARLGAVPLKQAWLSARGRQARVPLPAGMALSRSAFDAGLIEEAVRAGADFLPRTQASLGSCTSEARAVVLRSCDRTVEARAGLVLAADGLGCRLLNGTMAPAARGARIGAGVVADSGPDAYAPGAVFMARAEGGYVGVVRVEGGRLDIAAALDAAFVRQAGGPGGAAAEILREAGLTSIDGLEQLPWRGTPPLTRPATRLAGHRLFVLGDAAGYVEPFTGEGIAWALASAQAVTPLALRGMARWEPILGIEWERVQRRTVMRRQWTCKILARVLRHSFLTEVLIQTLAWLPGVARPVTWGLNR